MGSQLDNSDDDSDEFIGSGDVDFGFDGAVVEFGLFEFFDSDGQNFARKTNVHEWLGLIFCVMIYRNRGKVHWLDYYFPFYMLPTFNYNLPGQTINCNHSTKFIHQKNCFLIMLFFNTQSASKSVPIIFIFMMKPPTCPPFSTNCSTPIATC